MLRIGDGLLMVLSMKLLDTPSSRKSVVLTQGRALYLLHGYFDLDTLPIKKVQWGELFATLALMQSAEIIDIPSEVDDYDVSFREAFKQTALHSINQLKEEIIDSIARAECLYDKGKKTSSVSKSGGDGKANHIKPLKLEVIERYIERFSHLNKSRAGREIEKELTKEDSPLLLLSSNLDKHLMFAKWIGHFQDGEFKIPLKI